MVLKSGRVGDYTNELRNPSDDVKGVVKRSVGHVVGIDSILNQSISSELRKSLTRGSSVSGSSNSFVKLAIASEMYLGSYSNRLSREMRPYAVGSVESLDGTSHVLWNLRVTEDRVTRLLKAVEGVAYKKGKVMIVCTHRQRSRLALTTLSDLDCVHLVTKKWLNGMLSNHNTLRELVLKYRVTPSFEVTNATRERFDRYLAPIEDFLKSKEMPSLVLFINSGDHVTSIREVYNMGIPVGALCDVDASWNTFVDYAIPFPSRADAKSDVVMTEFETREYAQSTPRFVFMTLVRSARDRGIERRKKEELLRSVRAKEIGTEGKRGKLSSKSRKSSKLVGKSVTKSVGKSVGKSAVKSTGKVVGKSSVKLSRKKTLKMDWTSACKYELANFSDDDSNGSLSSPKSVKEVASKDSKVLTKTAKVVMPKDVTVSKSTSVKDDKSVLKVAKDSSKVGSKVDSTAGSKGSSVKSRGSK